MVHRWSHGNELQLLEGGEPFFSRVFETVRSARREVLIETFIWSEDSVGRALRDALIEAAERGASVDVTVDGYGTPSISGAFLAPLVDRGVRVFTFDPKPTWFGLRINPLCRLHRKIVVVDAETAFVGGINFAEDQECRRGENAKLDYAVEVRGPVVADIERFCHSARDGNAQPRRRPRFWLRRFPRALTDLGSEGQAALVTRDNAHHPTDIETLYRRAFRRARREIVLANAYFFPGYRFLRDLENAAARGVRVCLVLQGRPDKGYPQAATETLYDRLLANGIRVFRYRERALHAKVAVVDEEWATVGSSNLDPTSFALNLEANLFVRDRRFARELRGRLDRVIQEGCEELVAASLPAVTFWRRALQVLLYHVGRHFPVWARRFPLGAQRIRALSSSDIRAQPPP